MVKKDKHILTFRTPEILALFYLSILAL